ncbi:MAG: TIGR02757 family protein [Desulfobacteraceae bacterium]|jgi:uncharacterized protein (TIGR02757 family)
MKARLESLYHTYNNPSYIHPDPLEYVRRYPAIKDREIAGVIASCLSFGRVSQILLTLSRVFDVMGPSPRAYVEQGSQRTFNKDYKGFVYRFVREEHLVSLLTGLGRMIEDHGTLENCFVSGLSHDDETIVPAMGRFVNQIVQNYDPGYLVARPDKGSAMKRMNLFLRWMVRQDAVDPGGWNRVDQSRLIIPLDTHMHRISKKLGLTERNQADMRTAMEITESFRRFSPNDPVKYDFSLTRFGIRSELDMDQCCLFLNSQSVGAGSKPA